MRLKEILIILIVLPMLTSCNSINPFVISASPSPNTTNKGEWPTLEIGDNMIDKYFEGHQAYRDLEGRYDTLVDSCRVN